MIVNATCSNVEPKLKKESVLVSLLKWFLSQKIDGAEYMSKTK
ncbi:hypothetical protein MTsPCn9_17440 [Croceitalea sp. MTPC9]|nr:hypothetical protein MTsPCn6_10290 [Croceitalea sp. MTPC6]GMN16808.1 hypothetical protein MTsPCn9_17440 [Croceitalea sp. MTPC9]